MIDKHLKDFTYGELLAFAMDSKAQNEIQQKRIEELEQQLNYFLERVGVDSGGIWIPCGLTKVDPKETLKRVKAFFGSAHD